MGNDGVKVVEEGDVSVWSGLKEMVYGVWVKMGVGVEK